MIDISELYSTNHDFADYVNEIKVENQKLIIKWKSQGSWLNTNECLLENNGQQWAIYVIVSMNDEKNRIEAINIPKGVTKIVVDRIRVKSDKPSMTGFEQSVIGDE